MNLLHKGLAVLLCAIAALTWGPAGTVAYAGSPTPKKRIVPLDSRERDMLSLVHVEKLGGMRAGTHKSEPVSLLPEERASLVRTQKDSRPLLAMRGGEEGTDPMLIVLAVIGAIVLIGVLVASSASNDNEGSE